MIDHAYLAEVAIAGDPSSSLGMARSSAQSLLTQAQPAKSEEFDEERLLVDDQPPITQSYVSKMIRNITGLLSNQQYVDQMKAPE